jgi:hypothetical protein
MQASDQARRKPDPAPTGRSQRGRRGMREGYPLLS